MEDPAPSSTTTKAHFSAKFLTDIKKASSFRYNFAVNLVRECFTEEIRKISNVSGKCGKQALNPDKMQAINEATFQLYPCERNENKLTEWKKCRTAIDESCRRLNRANK